MDISNIGNNNSVLFFRRMKLTTKVTCIRNKSSATCDNNVLINLEDLKSPHVVDGYMIFRLCYNVWGLVFILFFLVFSALSMPVLDL